MTQKSAAVLSDKTVFLTGATGYVGGSYLQVLLSLPNPPKITVLVRNQAKADILSSKPGITAVIGDFSDTDKLSDLAAAHDIVIETADSDNQPLITALIAGIKRRKAKGLDSVFIHVSGTGQLVDDARGEYPSDVVYTDGKPNPPKLLHINDLPDTAFHRSVDLAIVEADTQGYCKSYIIFPGTVWGQGNGELFDKGVSNPHSSQIPSQAKASIARGKAGMVGNGLNTWVHVHIDDLSAHFQKIYDAALDNTAPHGREGYFLATSGEYRLLEVAKSIGEVLKENGWSATATPDSFAEEELSEFYGSLEEIGATKYYSGTNSRGESAQATALGWVPKWTEAADFYKYVRDEAKRVGEAKGKEDE